jgi:hypothetical protein
MIDLEMAKSILQLIATYGLPIVLCIWFVFRIDVTITKLVGLLEVFIAWYKEKDKDKEKKEAEMKETVKELVKQNGDILHQIELLGAKVDK